MMDRWQASERKQRGGEDEATAFAREFAREALAEQRRARRWGVFFKLAFLGYLIVLLLASAPSWLDLSISGGRHTAVVEVEGVIAHDRLASADNIVTALRKAFEAESAAGVVLRINSPGGSPVQAGYINDEISRLRAEHPDTPLYAVIADVGASGGYYVAAAADAIYADKASIVGSIGVRMDGFGFTEAIDKLGVERRLLTAGENKGLLDPFLPLAQEEVQHVEGLLEQMHAQFIETVKRGRGRRLAADERLFSGLIWTGEQGVGARPVDGLGSTSYVAREIVGAEELVDYTVREDYFTRLSRKLGAAILSGFEAAWPLR